MLLVSYLLINATNIVNKGTLMAGANGQIVVTGTNVTLARNSELEIASITPEGSFNSSTNFTPDVQIYDLYWGATNIMSLNTDWDFWFGDTINNTLFYFLVNGGTFPVNTVCGWANVPFLSDTFSVASLPSISDGMIPLVITTNIFYTDSNSQPAQITVPVKMYKQAVFINIADPNITAQISYSPSSVPGNPNSTVAVRFTAVSTNVLTQSPQTDSIYFVDTLASETNRGLRVSTVTFDPFFNECSGPAYRPANYILSRTDPGGIFASGASALDNEPPDDFFYVTPPGSFPAFGVFIFTNNVVQAYYSDYRLT